MKFLTALLIAIVMPVVAEEWKSPHSLKSELEAPVALLPFPSEVTWHDGTCPAHAAIIVMQRPDTATLYHNEGYDLEVGKDRITITTATDAGEFYAMQTLNQLKAGNKYHCCAIRDIPAFPIRGFLHDVGRNFQTIESLKQQLDEMAKVKINTFQWHLTDHPAWRIECKKYPILNDPSKRTKDRDINDTYSYDEIRELFRFAKERHIQIIPEIDMPGHSEYFTRCFGFPMHSDKGMDILEELLDEFCREIPADMCPYIHIGADEVRIRNAAAFIERMGNKIISHGRRPMQWGGPHDLPVSPKSISQLWGDEKGSGIPDPGKIPTAFIDSTAGYINVIDPALLIRRYFFRQPCGSPQATEKCLGAIACLWPDVRVDDKTKIPRHNPQWPAIFAMAERSWKGLPVDGSRYAGVLPERHSEAYKAFASFEKRMEALSKNLPFPYWRDSFIVWEVTDPIPEERKKEVRNAFLTNDEEAINGIILTRVDGGNLYLRSRAASEGLFPKQKPGVTVFARTVLNSKSDRTIHAMIGFDAPGRATRRATGVPRHGEWSQCGSAVWLNGKSLANPKTYKLAGQRRFEKNTWFTPANEIPFDDEEFWWALPPTEIRLRKGENVLLVEQPYIGDFQSWNITFIPVRQKDGKWIADESLYGSSGSGYHNDATAQ